MGFVDVGFVWFRIPSLEMAAHQRSWAFLFGEA